MGLTNSQMLNKTNNEDQAVTIIVEEESDDQSIAPGTAQLRTDGDELIYRARELKAEAALLRTGGDELGAQQLDEESQRKIAEATEKYREYISQCFGPQERDALIQLVAEAFALLQQADELMKKKPKRPGDFFKARDMYRESRDKYWLLKRDLHSYTKRMRECLRRDEDAVEDQNEYGPSFIELMRRLDDLDTRLNQRIKAIDYFKEAFTKPIIFIVIIVLILIIILITYFCSA